MNTSERIKMIKAMEMIARNLNNEAHLHTWLIEGVADGDIAYGDLTVQESDVDDLEYYMEDESFADLMDSFLYAMFRAYKSGAGLYCDGVASKPEGDQD